MDIEGIIHSLEGCSCGRKHTTDLRAAEIDSGNKSRVGEILAGHGFPRRVLVVADKNTLAASGGEGFLDCLRSAGFEPGLRLYNDLRVAELSESLDVAREAGDYDALLSVGTGSLNDICRYASAQTGRDFAIFGTAASMDGFASDSAPLISDGFKTSMPARQPSIIIADTAVLAAAPAELKSAGFGDMVAKLIGLVDWKIAAMVSDEFYCEAVASLTRRAASEMLALAPKITSSDEATAKAVMEALILSGITMQFIGTTRPASGTEHIVSHFWEVKKGERGELSDFHGKKVGVATMAINRIYHRLAENETITPTRDMTDWSRVRSAYGERLYADVQRLNNPSPTESIDPRLLGECWPQIRELIAGLPSEAEIDNLMRVAGAARTLADIAVDRPLGLLGLEFHPYMRHRITLMRLLPMLGLSVDYESCIY